MLTRVLTIPYVLPHPATDPDPSILALNADLLSFDDTLTTHLASREHVFITSGLASLVDAFLVRNADKIEAMNRNGCGRMQLNVLVLQQNLKAVETQGTVMLNRSARFFDYFMEGAASIVQRAKRAAGSENTGSASNDVDAGTDGINQTNEQGKVIAELGFTFEELKVLIELCYSEGLRSSQREVAVQAKRGLSEHLLVLSEVLWNA